MPIPSFAGLWGVFAAGWMVYLALVKQHGSAPCFQLTGGGSTSGPTGPRAV